VVVLVTPWRYLAQEMPEVLLTQNGNDVCFWSAKSIVSLTIDCRISGVRKSSNISKGELQLFVLGKGPIEAD